MRGALQLEECMTWAKHGGPVIDTPALRPLVVDDVSVATMIFFPHFIVNLHTSDSVREGRIMWDDYDGSFFHCRLSFFFFFFLLFMFIFCLFFIFIYSVLIPYSSSLPLLLLLSILFTATTRSKVQVPRYKSLQVSKALILQRYKEG